MKTSNYLTVRRSVGLSAFSLIVVAIPLHGQKLVSTSFSMPVHVQAAVEMAGCDNSPGPQITLDGDVALGGLTVQLTFRNNSKGTHTYNDQVSVETTAVPAGGTMQIPKQPVLGGVGGNPFIWVQMVNGRGEAMTDEVFLGRCVQGPFEIDARMSVPVVAVAAFTALDCYNNPGPYISVEGAMGFTEGISARFIFRNNDNPVGGPHRADRSVNMTVIASGATLEFPKQPVLGGVGGNPWIWASFLQGDDTVIGKSVLLGRCVQLAPGN